MTEFEAASLSLREAALWVAIAGVLVGAGKLAAICWGIRVMNGIYDDWRRDIEARNRRTEEYARQARKRHAEAMRQGRERHEEAMAALTELIRRTDAPGTA